MKSEVDASINNEIFRNDQNLILASRRDLAKFDGVILAYHADGYIAGQVLAYNTATSVYGKYSLLSGSYPAAAVLARKVRAEEMDATTGAGGLGIFGGYLYSAKLIDGSAQAKTDLGGRDYTDATGVVTFKF